MWTPSDRADVTIAQGGDKLTRCLVVVIDEHGEGEFDAQWHWRDVGFEPASSPCEVSFVLGVALGPLDLFADGRPCPGEQGIIELIADDELDPLVDRTEVVIPLLEDQAGLRVDHELNGI